MYENKYIYYDTGILYIPCCRAFFVPLLFLFLFAGAKFLLIGEDAAGVEHMGHNAPVPRLTSILFFYSKYQASKS